MIFETLHLMKEELNRFFGELPDPISNPVFIENIANIDNISSPNDIFLTLLNVQEEVTLKNKNNSYIENFKVNYRNPTVNLNLFILFSVNINYNESLKRITKIIQFFQGKKVFTDTNYNVSDDGPLLGLEPFKLIADLYTPSFEELNNIWGSLGGKQYPSVMYKVSMVEIERDVLLSEGSVITEISNTLINK